MTHLGRPAYVLAALLFLVPLADWINNVWPLQPTSIAWRYEAKQFGKRFEPVNEQLLTLVSSVGQAVAARPSDKALAAEFNGFASRFLVIIVCQWWQRSSCSRPSTLL